MKTLAAAALACGTLILTQPAAHADGNTVPANDPNCPGCFYTAGHVVQLSTGDTCVWAHFDWDNNNQHVFVLNVADKNYDVKSQQLLAAFASGDAVTFEHRNEPGACASPSGTKVIVLHVNREIPR